ncbi:MAG: hypothetical protein A7316_06535 [Candidatus Altiarchaeales archaeon WOR_SM1_86-2]|nr:MAG: hypothetical protein A7316_06535 [Candidatus Altiarchaeales archaeon WOR_SM1_86-2]
MIAVSDSSPLINLAKVNKLSLIREFFDMVFIPDAVYDEVVIQGADQSGAVEIDTAEWIKTKTIKNLGLKNFLRIFLDVGESEAIVLAEEIKPEVILIDDLAARIVAKGQGMKVMGTLGILERAYKTGRIDDLRNVVDDLRSKGFWMSEKLYDELIKESQ